VPGASDLSPLVDAASPAVYSPLDSLPDAAA
jgi:hypothetical protein